MALGHAGPCSALYESEAKCKEHLAAWLTLDRTGCTPLSYGSLKYLLADALVEELGLRGEISLMSQRGSNRQP